MPTAQYILSSRRMIDGYGPGHRVYRPFSERRCVSALIVSTLNRFVADSLATNATARSRHHHSVTARCFFTTPGLRLSRVVEFHSYVTVRLFAGSFPRPIWYTNAVKGSMNNGQNDDKFAE